MAAFPDQLQEVFIARDARNAQHARCIFKTGPSSGLDKDGNEIDVVAGGGNMKRRPAFLVGQVRIGAQAKEIINAAGGFGPQKAGEVQKSEPFVVAAVVVGRSVHAVCRCSGVGRLVGLMR